MRMGMRRTPGKRGEGSGSGRGGDGAQAGKGELGCLGGLDWVVVRGLRGGAVVRCYLAGVGLHAKPGLGIPRHMPGVQPCYFP